MGQALLREVTFTVGELRLEGVLHLPTSFPAPGVVVCHPHPLYGGDMDNNVVVAACDSLVSGGCVAMRFNFRGAGMSGGSFDQGRGERDDLKAAIDFLVGQQEVDRERLGVAGYSFGAVVAAEVASPRLRAIALISPPLAFSDLRIDWGCPALLLGGDEDEVAPADRLRSLAAHANVEVTTFEGADHSWWGYEHDLGSALAEFFGRQFT